jgi:hypothetical protein
MYNGKTTRRVISVTDPLKTTSILDMMKNQIDYVGGTCLIPVHILPLC